MNKNWSSLCILSDSNFRQHLKEIFLFRLMSHTKFLCSLAYKKVQCLKMINYKLYLELTDRFLSTETITNISVRTSYAYLRGVCVL